jgi:hypothetical protein
MLTSRIRAGRAVLAVVAIAVFGVTAVGCSSNTPVAPAASVAAPASPSAAPVMVVFGQPHRFTNGLIITLEAPRVYQPRQGNGSVLADRVLQVHMTIGNDTTQSYEMTGPHTVDVAATVNGQATEYQSINAPPEVTSRSGTLLPGQVQGFDYLYGIPPQPADMVFTVTERTAAPEAVFYRGQTPTAEASPPVTSTNPPPTTTRAPVTTTTRAPVTTTNSSVGCAQRAMAAGKFDPSCPEYQGYLDPGGPGRGPTSGDIQHQYGCQQGYIPASQC